MVFMGLVVLVKVESTVFEHVHEHAHGLDEKLSLSRVISFGFLSIFVPSFSQSKFYRSNIQTSQKGLDNRVYG
jgi:hypothetical protein